MNLKERTVEVAGNNEHYCLFNFGALEKWILVNLCIL